MNINQWRIEINFIPVFIMVLNTEWTQLEIIELLNELPSQNLEDVSNIKGLSSGNGGFGFGITGNKSTGVVVKVITPRGSASKVYNLYFIIL